MGKASRWFRGLLGLNKSETGSARKPSKEKRRWSFVKSYREEQQQLNNNNNHYNNNNNNNHGAFSTEHVDNKQAIAVAAATAAAAEAAVAAAQAAAAVVRFTASNSIRIRQEWAAVKIQAAFRGCLARKALRALKGLVKLQALVRGHIERKRTAEWLKRMQALVRTQARVGAGRALQASHSNAKSSTSHLHGPATPEKSESPVKSRSMKHEQPPILKRNGSKSCVLFNANQDRSGNISESLIDEQSWNKVRSLIKTYSRNDGKSDTIVEIDSGKQRTSKHRNLFHSTSDILSSDQYYSKSTSHQSGQTQSQSYEAHYYNSPLKVNEVEESPFCTAHNSPQFYSATSKDEGYKRSPFTTPTKSDGSRNYLRGYSDYPSYMAYTESSKAKVRSLSAPKQRPSQYEKSSSSNRYSLNGYEVARLATQRNSALQASFSSKAYPGSGRLDKLGMPVGYRY